jgi:hypothetical protein
MQEIHSIASEIAKPTASELHDNIETTPEDDYRRELTKLSDIGFVFLNATDGDPAEAEELLDSFIDLLFEAGALSTWRYRILLAEIRRGL